MNRLLDQLRRAVHAGKEPLSDGELLTRFIERREESAFETLLRRHGPMVLGVCRRVLGNPHDADDAFQATFLVLVRKAASVRPREAVGNWLYGVAYRTSLEARTRIARRRVKEKQVEDMPHPEVEQDRWHELGPLLDRELSRLSDKYRLPVVLCDVEGRSRKEVARQLAIPEGTLSSRLATARKKLAARLARYGFTLSGASLAGLLAENAASACVPASLLGATTKAAMLVAAGQAAAAGVVSVTVAALTEGVLKTMFLAKLKTATVVLFGVAVLGSVGTGGLLYQTRAGAAGSPQRGQKQPAGPVIANNSSVPKATIAAQQREKDERRRTVEEEVLARENEARAEQRKAEALFQRAQEAYKAAEAQRAAAEKRRQSVEVERQRAEETLKKAKALLDQIQTAEDPGRLDQALNRLGNTEAKLREQLTEVERQRAKLLGQQRVQLEQLAKVKHQLTELLRQGIAAQPKPRRPSDRLQNPVPKIRGGDQAPDKLDRILERLERLEKRLDRLERGKPLERSIQ